MNRLFTIVGLPYYDYNKNKGRIFIGDLVELRREPGNCFDKNAIACYYEGNKKIGYVSKNELKHFKANKNQIIGNFKIRFFWANVMTIEEITPYIIIKEVGLPEYKPFGIKKILKKIFK